MGNRGRFGKYGEAKRIKGLRHSRANAPSPPGSNIKPLRSRKSLQQTTSRMARITVRDATDSDASFIGRLSGKVFSIYGPYGEMVPRWFALEMTHTLIAMRDGKPVGFAMLGSLSNRYDQADVSELLAIAVDPKKQGIGVGEMLLQEIERKAINLNIKRVFLHTAVTNLTARRLFTKRGYSPWEIKRDFYPAGQDAVVMSKEISWSTGSRG